MLNIKLCLRSAISAISAAELAHFPKSTEDPVVNFQYPQKPGLKTITAAQFHQSWPQYLAIHLSHEQKEEMNKDKYGISMSVR
jgi:hypothetical protein